MPSPVIVSFRGDKKRRMASAVDAYMYLLSCFYNENRDIFNIYEKRGDQRKHFAHTEDELFQNPKHRHKPGYSHPIKGTSWFANTHSHTRDKLEILKKLSDIAGLAFDADWTWEEL